MDNQCAIRKIRLFWYNHIVFLKGLAHEENGIRKNWEKRGYSWISTLCEFKSLGEFSSKSRLSLSKKYPWNHHMIGVQKPDDLYPASAMRPLSKWLRRFIRFIYHFKICLMMYLYLPNVHMGTVKFQRCTEIEGDSGECER